MAAVNRSAIAVFTDNPAKVLFKRFHGFGSDLFGNFLKLSSGHFLPIFRPRTSPLNMPYPTCCN